MTRLPRLLLAAALGVVVAGSTRAAEPNKLLPAEADTVAVINVKQAIESDIVKKYALEQLKQALEGQDVKGILGDLGLDPLKDLDQVVLATVDTSKSDTKFLAIIHGKFDPEKLFKAAEAQAKKDPDKFSIIKDGATVMFKYQGDSGQPVYGSVANDKTLVASTEKKYITAALAASDANKPAPIKKDLAELIKKADDKATVFVASLLKGKLNDVMLPGGGNLPIKLDDLQKALPSLETAVITVKVGTDVTAEVTLGMKDEDAAGDMRNAVDELLKQIAPLAQLAGAAEPRAKPLADILKTIKTSSKNKDVIITGKITGAEIGKIINPNAGD